MNNTLERVNKLTLGKYHDDQYKLTLHTTNRSDLVWLVSLALAMEDISINKALLSNDSTGQYNTEFIISPIIQGEIIDNGRWQQIKHIITKTLLDKNYVADLYNSSIDKSRELIRHTHVADVVSSIKAEYNSNINLAVLTVKTLDRPFLLADITREIYRCGFIIKKAIISTDIFQVSDIFYLQGEISELVDISQITRLEMMLHNSIE